MTRDIEHSLMLSAIVDIKDFDKLRATHNLIIALEKGEQSARDYGWISADEVEAELMI